MKPILAQGHKPALSSSPAAKAAGAQSSKSALPETNRRVRTSAAMIGLALSMGASSILLPGQAEKAAAAEAGSQTKASAESLPSRSRILSFGTLASASATRYTVRAGQNLWEIAAQHGVDAKEVAAFNDLSIDEILQVGQLIRIPTPEGHEVSQANSIQEAPASRGGFSDEAKSGEKTALSLRDKLSTGTPSASFENLDNQLKQEQTEARSKLRESRMALQDSLASLDSEGDELSLDSSRPQSQKADADPRQVDWGNALPSSDAQAQRAQGSTIELKSDSPGSADFYSADEISEQDIQVSEIQEPAEENSASQTNGELDLAAIPNDASEGITEAHVAFEDRLIAENQLSNADLAPANQPLQAPSVQTEVRTTQPNSFAAIPTLQSPESVDLLQEPSNSETSALLAYEVQPGDTLNSITQLHGVSKADLLKLNQLSNPNWIFAGTTLMIPQAPSADAEAIESSGLKVPVPTTETSKIAPGIVEAEDSLEVTAEEQAGSRLGQNSSGVGGQDSSSDVNPYVANLKAEVAALRERRQLEKMLAQSGSPQAREEALETASVTPVGPSSLSTEKQVAESEPSVNPYVANLRAEVAALRERRRLEESFAREKTAEVEIASTQQAVSDDLDSLPERQVNPEFEGRDQVAALQEQIREAREGRLESTGESAPGSDSSEVPAHLMAAAPLGAEEYSPVVQPMTGRVVSPDLPVMPGADNYLPDSPAIFNGYSWPAKGVLTSGYGWRWGRMHQGIDIAAPVGTPIHAAGSGVVETSGWNSGGYGNLVEVRHPDGSLTLYAHNNRLLVQKGQQVTKGQQIAEMGSTGYSTGPHLHFEIHPKGQGAVNPVAYLPNS